MFSIGRLMTALSGLADNLAALAGTVATIDRGRLALDVPAAPPETAVLTHQPPQDGPADAAEGNGPLANGKGRKRAAGAV